MVGVIVGAARVFEQKTSGGGCEVCESGVGAVRWIVSQGATGAVDKDLVLGGPDRVEASGRVGVDNDGGCGCGCGCRDITVRACRAGDADGWAIDIKASVGGSNGRFFDRHIVVFACCEEQQRWSMAGRSFGEGPEAEEGWEGNGGYDDGEEGQKEKVCEHGPGL